MAQTITENDKLLLHKAVDTGSAAFIAQCVLNVLEIYEKITELLSADPAAAELNPLSPLNALADDGADALLDTEIKEEPVEPLLETDIGSDDGHEETATRSRNDVLPSPKEAVSSGPCLQCFSCQRECRSVKKYYNHVLSHSRSGDELLGGSILCAVCSQPSLTLGSYLEHLQSAHLAAPSPAAQRRAADTRPRKFTCDQCPFVTHKRTNYRQHMSTHLPPDSRPYRCEHKGCTYTSANKECLIIHRNNMHKGVKPFLCDVCGQSFSGTSMLSKHRLMKHKPKHLSCPHCDYKTSLLNWLKDHMKKHSNDAPFSCPHCSYAAKKAGRLKVHLRIHTGERPYKCHMCEYGAMEGAPLKKHLKNQHDLNVKRIDIREGKLFLANGKVLETGLNTKTAPLPPGSYPAGSKEMWSGGDAGAGRSHDQSEINQVPYYDTTHRENIIAQAASLSALPMDESMASPAPPQSAS